MIAHFTGLQRLQQSALCMCVELTMGVEGNKLISGRYDEEEDEE